MGEPRDEPGAERLSPVRVLLVGTGPLADAIARRGEAQAWQVRRSGPTDAEAVDLAIWAVEEGTPGALLDAARGWAERGLAFVSVRSSHDVVRIGPLCVPGLNACPGCGSPTLAPALEPCPEPLRAAVAAELGVGIERAARDTPTPVELVAGVIERAVDGGRRSLPLHPRRDCPVCAGATARASIFEPTAALAVARGPSGGRIEVGRTHAPDRPVRRVGVVGGGTAGYLTALALRRHRPELEVTIIESSRYPIIGVGEATTPEMVRFMLDRLGVEELDLYREVAPTWKLGIRFVWGTPARRPHFHHPFSGPYLLEAMARDHDPELQSLGCQLMEHGLAPVMRGADGRVSPHLEAVPYAWHLDNPRLVRFLGRLAHERGIPRVDATIERVERGADGAVRALEAHDGRRFELDFYVDATGFSSRLLGEALGVGFLDFGRTLFNDAALVGETPARGAIAPFTLAETMDAGWCWTIPTRAAEHRGYVFSTSFVEPDVAEAELRAHAPEIGELRTIRFRTGRHVECWRHNVFAVGNAYGFVEPLESTALFMVIDQIEHLLASLPRHGALASAAAHVNERIGAHWDQLRGFLALHFRFNRRRDTAYWRACRGDVELGEGQRLADAFAEGAPLSARPDRELLRRSLLGDHFFGLLGVDNVLFGQGLPTRVLEPTTDATRYLRWRDRARPALLARALPHREALDAYERWLERHGPGRGAAQSRSSGWGGSSK